MAQKRMFDKRIVESDKFVDLPNSSKALYFMAGMSADDRGFFQPRSLQRMYGFSEDDFKIKLKGTKANVMTTISGGVMTGLQVCEIKSNADDVCIEGTDILKMMVVERHKMTGNIGKGLIKGYGFNGGAMGISVAHDSHNIILLGDDNKSLLKATNACFKPLCISWLYAAKGN